MRIVIDMQGTQSASRTRGIGRYTMELVSSICNNRGDHEIILALSGLFPDTIEPIRKYFAAFLPQKNIHVWYALNEVKYLFPENDWRRQAAELTREAFLAHLNPDIILVTSLFEGQVVDDAVTSVGCLGHIPTAVILYDLIPLIYPDRFLGIPQAKKWYESKLDHLRRADLLLSISDSSRQEAIELMGFSEDSIVNISSAVSTIFKPQVINEQLEADIRVRYSLNKPFLMSAATIEERKNIDGLIRAYALIPSSVREQHQLVLTGESSQHYKEHLTHIIQQAGLREDEVVLTGYVPDNDLLALYNLCKAFAFASFHEGFGLPILEAMSCGKAVICSNLSSMPEVIEQEDALFDPHSLESIAHKISQVLTDEVYRKRLEKHALEQAQKFSWDKSAIRAINALEGMRNKSKAATCTASNKKLKLAYITTLPSIDTKISTYSAKLIPEITDYYDIDIIIDQETVSSPWIINNCQMRTTQWFINHADEYDRILYHCGNASAHQHIFDLVEDIPGVIVLHDFFYANLLKGMDQTGFLPGCFVQELYNSHGYAALEKYLHSAEQDIINEYPCNLRLLQNNLGIIIHSQSLMKSAQKYYHTDQDSFNWAQIPLVREETHYSKKNKQKSKKYLGFKESDFILCSFGPLAAHKLDSRLLDAWIASDLAKDPNCFLVFVGEAQGHSAHEIFEKIENSGLKHRIKITGKVNHQDYTHYLQATDLAVQLQTLPSDELLDALVDCMSSGLATLINTQESSAEILSDAVWQIAENFSDLQLLEALTTLWQNNNLRQRLEEKARHTIKENHNPKACAYKYFQAIEKFYQQAGTDSHSLIRGIAHLEMTENNKDSWRPLVECIAKSIPPKFAQKQILFDISMLVTQDAKSGIQRVVRAILKEWLTNPPEGYRVEPVYATPQQGYRYARKFTLKFLGAPFEQLNDDPIEYRNGDIFVNMDLYQEVAIAHKHFYKELRNHGVAVYFIVYDIIPISLRNCFPEIMYELHSKWLEVAVNSDGVICISNSVANEVALWIKENGVPSSEALKISWFHQGADIERSSPTFGMPQSSQEVLRSISEKTTFLMVGTIEPRKGYAQTLDAFTKLWESGNDINLVLVGKSGWQVDELINKIKNNPENGKHLFWLEGISDEYLEKIYASSTCLIAASEGEGFGLPLIEAARHKIPIIARDIPVFREVAGQHAFYFAGTDPLDFANAVQHWLALYQQGQIPDSQNMPWQTWKQSAQQLWNAITSDPRNDISILEDKVA